MRIVIQRVNEASVTIDGKLHSAVGKGFMVLVGVATGDVEDDARWLAQKTSTLRVFDDENGVMNRSIMDVNGEIMVVSQFTLYASYKKGNRPSWFKAAPHEISIPLYNTFCDTLSRSLGKTVKTGEFGANMQISLVNDGPVTICMDTHHKE